MFKKSNYDQPIKVPRAINAWLQVLAVLLFASGIMGFILERKFYGGSR